MKNTKWIIAITIACISQISYAQQPYGLLTDLIEHTETVWQNGYPSNILLWESRGESEEASDPDGIIEAVQFAEIRSRRPSFSWIVPGDKQGTVQTAYQIEVETYLGDAVHEDATIWESGWVESNQSTGIIMGGRELNPSLTYFWRVRVRTNTDGESPWSERKAFRTASHLQPYQAAYYPQVKTMQHPTAVNQVEKGVYLADFGKDAFGQVLLTLASDNNQDNVQIHLGECLSGGRVDRKPGGTIRYHQYTLQLMKGVHTYRIKIDKDERNTRSAAILMPPYIGEVLPFRYCEIEGYNQPLIPSDLVREMVHYPFDDHAASFQCSHDTLNQIWELCKYSIKATSFAGIYVDGDRERIPYEADALINQLCHYGVDREYSMARRSHEYLLEHPTWPTEWILQAVLIGWYDYLYTGDSRSLKANYDILKARTLMQLREKNGLISTTTGLQTPDFLKSIRFDGPIKDIVDWPHTGILGLNKHEGGEADGFVFTDYNVVTNAYHYEALKLMSQIAEVLNLSDEALYYKKEAHSFLDRFNKAFFKNSKGYYVDGDTTMHPSLHGNMFPLAFGMVPQNKKQQVLEFIRSRGMACSVYGSQFLMDAIYEANDAEYGLKMLTKSDDRSWYNMIRVGSTISLEAWDNKYKPNQDWNHAWGAAPANLIPRKLMGLEPLVPGFEKVRIKPQPASLEWAKATIPTIRGDIRLSFENRSKEWVLQVTIPANMNAEVYLPVNSGSYKVRRNNEVIQAPRVKGEPFLYAGKLGSGTYEFIVERK